MPSKLDSLARPQIRQAGSPQNLNVEKDVLIPTENVRKPKALGLVEPLHPCGFKGQAQIDRLCDFPVRRRVHLIDFARRRINPENFNSLN